MPYIGYFIIDGLELGLNPLGYRYASYENYSNYNITIMFAPSYNFDTKSKIYPFIEGRIGYTSHNYKDTNPPEVDETWSGLSYGAAGGVKFILGESSLLKAGASYMFYTYMPESADNRYGYNELMLELGFMVFFGKS